MLALSNKELCKLFLNTLNNIEISVCGDMYHVIKKCTGLQSYCITYCDINF